MRRLVLAASLLVAVLALPPEPLAAQGPTYPPEVVDLGSLGGTEAGVLDVNDAGVAVGYGFLPGDAAYHAWVYDPASGELDDIGTLGGTNSFAVAINEAGIVVGESDVVGDRATHAFVYDMATGVMTDLGTLGGTDSDANDINEAGVIVGTAETPGDLRHAYALDWANGGSMENLGTLGGSTSSGQAINAAGVVVGSSRITGDTESHGYRVDWANGGTMEDLGTLGGDGSIARAINDDGTITGEARVSAGGSHAFRLLPGGTMEDLGTLGGFAASGYAISNSGQIGGYGWLDDDTTERAFIWDPTTGELVEMPTLGGDNARIVGGGNASGVFGGVAEVEGGDGHAALFSIAGPPQAPVVSGEGCGQLPRLTWEAPPDGGALITGYVVRDDGAEVTTLPPDQSAFAIAMVLEGPSRFRTDGRAHTWTVTAVNVHGESPASNAVTLPACLPEVLDPFTPRAEPRPIQPRFTG